MSHLWYTRPTQTANQDLSITIYGPETAPRPQRAPREEDRACPYCTDDACICDILHPLARDNGLGLNRERDNEEPLGNVNNTDSNANAESRSSEDRTSAGASARVGKSRSSAASSTSSSSASSVDHVAIGGWYRIRSSSEDGYDGDDDWSGSEWSDGSEMVPSLTDGSTLSVASWGSEIVEGGEGVGAAEETDDGNSLVVNESEHEGIDDDHVNNYQGNPDAVEDRRGRVGRVRDDLFSESSEASEAPAVDESAAIFGQLRGSPLVETTLRRMRYTLNYEQYLITGRLQHHWLTQARVRAGLGTHGTDHEFDLAIDEDPLWGTRSENVRADCNTQLGWIRGFRDHGHFPAPYMPGAPRWVRWFLEVLDREVQEVERELQTGMVRGGAYQPPDRASVREAGLGAGSRAIPSPVVEPLQPPRREECDWCAEYGLGPCPWDQWTSFGLE